MRTFFSLAAFSAARSFSAPPVTVARDQSTHRANPSANNSSAILPFWKQNQNIQNSLSKSIRGYDDLTGWITVPTKLLLLEDSRITCTSRWRSRDSVKYLASSANGSVAFGSGLFSLSNLNAGLCKEKLWMNESTKWWIRSNLLGCQKSSMWCGGTPEARKDEA